MSQHLKEGRALQRHQEKPTDKSRKAQLNIFHVLNKFSGRADIKIAWEGDNVSDGGGRIGAKLDGVGEARSPSTRPVHDTVVIGFSEYDIQSFHIDFEKQTINVTSLFRHPIFTAEYEVKAKIVGPIEGRGGIRIATECIQTRVIMNYELIKKDPFEYIHFTSTTTKFTIKNYTMELRSLDGENADALTTAMRMAMQGGHQEMFKTFAPTIEKIISTQILKVAKAIGTQLPFNEFFPDTE